MVVQRVLSGMEGKGYLDHEGRRRSSFIGGETGSGDMTYWGFTVSWWWSPQNPGSWPGVLPTARPALHARSL